MSNITTVLSQHRLRFIGGFRRWHGGVKMTPWRPGESTKERQRHAGKPDGLMHRETPGLRSNFAKRAGAI